MAGFVDLLKLVVDADTKGAVSEFKKLESTAGSSLDGVERQSKSFGTKFSGGFSAIGSSLASSLGPAAIAGTVGAGIGVAINAASNLNEQISKTKAVFGESSDAILKWSDSSATSLGQSKTDALEAASSFGNLFQQLGLTGGAVVDMSTKMTGLASDFASFFNTDPASALEAISAAFRGEFDAVQKFVPTINAAAVQQEVLKEGLAKSTKEITEQDKAVATYNLLLNGAGKATGDFAKTSGSLANQQRILKAQISDAAAALGNQLLPGLASLAGFASKGITIVVDIKEKTGGDKSPFFMDLPKLIGTAWEGITTVKPPWKLFSDQVDKSAEDSTASIKALASGTASDFSRIAAGVAAAQTELFGFSQTAGTAASDFERLTTASHAIVSSADMIPTSADAAANSISRTGSEMGDLADASQKASDSLHAVHDAISGLNDAELDSAGIQQRVIEAMAKANEVAKDGKKTALEKQVADNDAIKAAKALAENHREIAEAQSKATTAAGKAVDGQKAYIDTLRIVANSAQPPVQAGINNLIASYENFGKQHPEATATANNTDAITKIDAAQQAAHVFGRTVATAAIHADDQASGKISAVKDGLDGIRGTHTATVSVNTSTAAANINRIIDGLNIINQAPGGSSIRYGHIASGTRNWRGGLAMVGELGPELVYLPKGAQVKTAADTQRILSPSVSPHGFGQQGQTGNVVQITVNGAVDPYSTARQIQTILAKGGYAGFSAKAA